MARKTINIKRTKKNKTKAKLYSRGKKTSPKLQKRHMMSFPIVAIGASAGGTEAFIEFLKYLPADANMAYVFIMHLAPGHESVLDQLISRATKIPVVRIKDNLTVKPSHLYVIPEDKDIAIKDGVLKLMPRLKVKGQHMPINLFFRSLAKDQDGNAIGIILSGTGSDGTEGLKELKACGGITFAQDDKTARHPEMVCNAIAAGCVDFVMTPQKLAGELDKISRHPYVQVPPSMVLEKEFAEKEDVLKKIFFLLHHETDVDFTYYKHGTIMRRLKRRITLHKLRNIDDYLIYIRNNPDEIKALYEDLLITLTGFFREPKSYDVLEKEIFPKLIKDRPAKVPIRVWIPGCSTGEEAYSIAILLMEFLEKRAAKNTFQIFASDISEKAIVKARQSVYQEGVLGDVSPQRLSRFFVKTDHGYQITECVREKCVFARQNIIKDPPFSNLDFISCRNVMIYLGPLLQQRVIPIFHYALKPGGFLMLSPSESIDRFADLFSLVDKKYRIYTKKETATRLHQEFIPLLRPGEMPGLPKVKEKVERGFAGIFDAPKEANSIILSRYTPAGVVVDKDMRILQFRGDTSQYLAPVSGQASLDLFKMIKQDLFVDVQRIIHNAEKEKTPAVKEEVQFKHNGKIKYVDIEAIPIINPVSKESFFLILFKETPSIEALKEKKAKAAQLEPARAKKEDKDREVVRLTQDLEQTREYLQSVIEKYEATNEELKSSNEELQSSNEELQSTNEELETAKEELQSANEELTTLNEELSNRNTELIVANNDITNLLSSVSIPIVMLGNDLCIKRFNRMAGKLLNFISADIGRHITHIKPNIEIPNLEELLLKTMDTLNITEKEAQDKEGRWYLLRILPYKTEARKIDGVVLTLVDIDKIKRYAEQSRRLATVVTDSNDAITVQDFQGNITAWNRGAEKMYGYSESEALKMNIRDITPEDKREETRRFVKAIEEVKSFETKRITKDGKILDVWLTVTKLVDDTGKPIAIATTERDITERKKAEDEIKQTKEEYETLIKNIPDVVYSALPNDTGTTIAFVSERCQDWTGYHPEDFYKDPKIWLISIHPEDKDKTIEAYMEAFKRKGDYIIEYRVVHKDTGEVRYLSDHGVPVKDKEDKIIRYDGVITDITARKQADEQIQRQSALLEAINKVFREALTCETEEELGKACLAEAEELTGSKFGFIGELSPAGLFDIIAISDPSWDACKMLHSVATRVIKNMPIRGIDRSTIREEKSRIVNEMETHPDRCGTPKGHPQITSFLGVPLKQAGKTIGMIGLGNKESGYDTNDQESVEKLSVAFVQVLFRKRSENALRSAQEQLVLKEKLAVLGQLGGGMAHELRNPLGAIKNAVYFLKMVLEKPEPEVEETLEILEKEVATSQRIINSLLVFAHPKPATKRKIDINGVIQKSLSHTTVPKNLEVVSHLDKALPPILADPDQLIHVFVNIILNAIQAMPKGGQLMIKSEVSSQEWIALSFTDTGMGIPKENLGMLFEPLFTTKAKGIGLGLAITSILVKGHGGTIEVQSELGEGTTFTVMLPIIGKDVK